MKAINNSFAITLAFLAMLLLSGCEHNISIGSVVNADGSLDRKIVLHNSDSIKAQKNIMGISQATGWKVVLGPPSKPTTEEDKKSEVNITFTKHFTSADEANREMNPATDTVFHVTSSFEKKNKWFYTYIEYRDTYRSLNLFNKIPQEEYFTKEDFAFIDRLPAEGTTISKADSLYLARLNEKIFDLYGSRTIFEEFYGHLLTTLRKHNAPAQWQDSLILKKEYIYQQFVQEGNLEEEDFLKVVGKTNIPIPPVLQEAVMENTRDIERRLNFMAEAYSGKYVHSIKMPWTVVESNADSVLNGELFWRPAAVKFLLRDYTMSATCRKINFWPVVISGMLICATIGLFLFRLITLRRHAASGV